MSLPSPHSRSSRLLHQHIQKEEENRDELIERLRFVEEIIHRLREEENLNEEEVNSREREASDIKSEIIEKLQLIEQLKGELAEIVAAQNVPNLPSVNLAARSKKEPDQKLEADDKNDDKTKVNRGMNEIRDEESHSISILMNDKIENDENENIEIENIENEFERKFRLKDEFEKENKVKIKTEEGSAERMLFLMMHKDELKEMENCSG